MLFISNETRNCVFQNQKIPQSIWDYHVVMLAFKGTWMVYDLDSTLPIPCQLDLYLNQTFNKVSQPPGFLVLDGIDYGNFFSSDRRHMVNPDGTWKATPPDWPLIKNGGVGFDLGSLMDFELHKSKVITLGRLRELFC